MRKHHITSLAAGWNWKQINEGGVYLPSLGRFFSRVTLSGFSSGSCVVVVVVRASDPAGLDCYSSSWIRPAADLASCARDRWLNSLCCIPEPVLACTAYRDYVLCPASGRYGTVCPDSALGPGCVRCDSVGLDCSCGPACDHFGSDGPDWGRDLCCGHFGSGGQGWARGPAFGRGCRLVCTVCRGSRRAPCSSRGCDHIRDHGCAPDSCHGQGSCAGRSHRCSHRWRRGHLGTRHVWSHWRGFFLISLLSDEKWGKKKIVHSLNSDFNCQWFTKIDNKNA